MNGIKLAVTKVESLLSPEDHIYYGILKREFKKSKYTLAEWQALIQDLKARPA